MKIYNGILGTVGIHTFYTQLRGAKHVLAEAMIRMGNADNYRIIREDVQVRKYSRTQLTSIQYEVLAG